MWRKNSACLRNTLTSIKRVVVLGPAHRVLLRGPAVSGADR
jgi:predicted class III extradiol MEMO1 family dioxygenase